LSVAECFIPLTFTKLNNYINCPWAADAREPPRRTYIYIDMSAWRVSSYVRYVVTSYPQWSCLHFLKPRRLSRGYGICEVNPVRYTRISIWEMNIHKNQTETRTPLDHMTNKLDELLNRITTGTKGAGGERDFTGRSRRWNG